MRKFIFVLPFFLLFLGMSQAQAVVSDQVVSETYEIPHSAPLTVIRVQDESFHQVLLNSISREIEGLSSRDQYCRSDHRTRRSSAYLIKSKKKFTETIEGAVVEIARVAFQVEDMRVFRGFYSDQQELVVFRDLDETLEYDECRHLDQPIVMTSKTVNVSTNVDENPYKSRVLTVLIRFDSLQNGGVPLAGTKFYHHPDLPIPIFEPTDLMERISNLLPSDHLLVSPNPHEVVFIFFDSFATWHDVGPKTGGAGSRFGIQLFLTAGEPSDLVSDQRILKDVFLSYARLPNRDYTLKPRASRWIAPILTLLQDMLFN